jgi:ferrous iron transport protein A
LRLTDLPLRQPAYVDSIDWSGLTAAESQRLREFGLCEGASIEALHHGGLMGHGPLACRIGRMTIAMRRRHAAAICVRTGPEEDEGPRAAAA